MRCVFAGGLVALTVGCAALSGDDLRARLDHDGDGVQLGTDCDDQNVETQFGPTWFADEDGDGYGDLGHPRYACSKPDGYVENSGDCDDTNAAISPGQDEACNGYDDDCDLFVDASDPTVTDGVIVYPDHDRDGDGPIGSAAEVRCAAGPGWTTRALDCDDHDPDVSSIAVEICDAKDNDCDGLVDAADPSIQGARTFFWDQDGDSFGAPTPTLTSCAVALSGYSRTADDCDDHERTIFPGAPELCGRVDRDCDGVVGDDDPDATGQALWFPDTDGDGFGDLARAETRCWASGWVANSLDCDDAADTSSPLAPDLCGDGVDSNCDELPPICLVPAVELAEQLAVWTPDQPDVGLDRLARGDVDGDGLDEVLVSSTRAAGAAGGEGVVWRLALPLDGLGLAAELVSGGAPGSELGAALAVVPNVVGDGRSGLLVGAPGEGAGDGALRLFVGPGPFAADDAVLTLRGRSGSAARVGETFAVGRVLADDALAFAVASPEGVWLVPPAITGDRFGETAAATLVRGLVPYSLAIGDLNGDGVDDLAIGARDPLGGPGGVYLFAGPLDRGTVTAASADALIVASDPADALGRSLAIADDMDGDGVAELLVSAARHNGVGPGAVYRFADALHASSPADAAHVLWATEDRYDGAAGFGERLIAAGHLNMDDAGEALILAPTWRDAADAAPNGRGWVLHGGQGTTGGVESASGLSLITATALGERAASWGTGGWDAITLPDQTGDDAAELLLLVPGLGADSATPGTGALFVLPGAGR